LDCAKKVRNFVERAADEDHMQLKATFVTVAVALALAAVACGGTPDASPDTSVMRMEKTCIQTKCQENQSHGGSACSACLSACGSASYGCNPDTACKSSCSRRDCSEAEKRDCAKSGFKADMPTNPSAELGAACTRLAAHEQECKLYHPQETGCKTISMTGRPELSKVSDCFAQLPCDELAVRLDPSTCNQPAASNFGDKLCDSIEAKCAGTCDALTRFALQDTGWLRSDVLSAASSCATQDTCDDVRGCLAAWVSAVTFPVVQ
jgi:hypothetical protein